MAGVAGGAVKSIGGGGSYNYIGPSGWQSNPQPKQKQTIGQQYGINTGNTGAGKGTTLQQQSYQAFLQGKKNWLPDAPGSLSFDDYVSKYFGGGGGGGGGGTAPVGSPEGNAGTLTNFGSGLLDPNSDMSKRWMENLREEVGKSTDAAERAAGYRAAGAGMGSGASPEMLQMQNDIGVAGQEAMGDAASDFMLRAPELGVSALGTGLGAQVGMRGQDLESRIAENSNALARESLNANLGMQQRGLDLQYEGLNNDRYLRELAYLYGM